MFCDCCRRPQPEDANLRDLPLLSMTEEDDSPIDPRPLSQPAAASMGDLASQADTHESSLVDDDEEDESRAIFTSGRDSSKQTLKLLLHAHREHWLIHGPDLEVKDDVLGQGSYGFVRAGLLHGCTEVAVKMIVEHTRKNTDVALNELRVLRRIRHPNIVLFHGVFCARNEDGPFTVSTVLELVDGPNFYSFVKQRRRNGRFEKELIEADLSHGTVNDTWIQEERVYFDVCRGMTYLHGQRPPILHRDLKPQNVLIDGTAWPPKAKVTDFGLSAFVETENSMRAKAGTEKYMAPEVFSGQLYDTPADVYSFGCIGVFILIASSPSQGNALNACKEAKTSCPHCLGSLRELAERCLHASPAERPSFRQASILLGSTAAASANGRKMHGDFGASTESKARSHSAGTSDERSDFPMQVMPMNQFLKLTTWVSFITAKRAGMLEAVSGKPVHYISHEWLSKNHPDPQGVRLRTLQGYFSSIMKADVLSTFSEENWNTFSTGTVKQSQVAARVATAQTSARHGSLEMASTEDSLNDERFGSKSTEQASTLDDDIVEQFKVFYREDVVHGTVWIDWFSIPQLEGVSESHFEATLADRECAIRSMPKYIQQSTYFYVCASPAQDNHGNMCNFRTWQQSGWCRMEEACNFLSPVQQKPAVILTQAPQVKLREFFDWFIFCANRREGSICNGKFGCCDCNHVIKGESGHHVWVRCDKTLLAPIIQAMYDEKLSKLSQSGNDFLFKILKCTRAAILAGSDLDCQTEACSPLERIGDFLEAWKMPADILEPDAAGVPAIEWAAFAGHVPMVKKLLDRGCPADVADKGGLTPLLGAALCSDSMRMTALLLKCGGLGVSAVNARTYGLGISALDRAAKGDNMPVVQLLLQAKADIDARRTDGYTPLLSAALAGNVEICKLLLSRQADLHAVSTDQEGVLHMAAKSLALFDRSCCSDMAALLLEAQADPTLQDAGGRTAVEIAEQEAKFELVKAITTLVPAASPAPTPRSSCAAALLCAGSRVRNKRRTA
eukprot:TRINITY_DN75571_c0_g1_i1.p1 TRINITY_DN75571_c0_g1~~TRINITY_DN75571_c0_g1_i1.p1  ORF type:complete len:1016 (-),score=188.24 TRINITY_DN75571_c0_g1_i1:173-3220(-)